MKNDTPVDASACGGPFDIASSFWCLLLYRL
jgi:hypothetical protein